MNPERGIEIDRPIKGFMVSTLNNDTEQSLACVEGEIINELPEVPGMTSRIFTRDRGTRLEPVGVITV